MTKYLVLSAGGLYLPIAVAESGGGGGTIYVQDDFESYADTDEMDAVWHMAEDTDPHIELHATEGYGSSQCAKCNYDTTGTDPFVLRRDVSSLNLSEVYVRFYSKVLNTVWDAGNSRYTGGCKYLKLFGKSSSPVGQANTTWPIEGAGVTLFSVYYGEGSGTDNDSQTTIRFNASQGGDFDPLVVLETTSATIDIRDNQWHCFEAHMKYSTNTESEPNIRDGIYEVWWDGVLKLRATNVRNRHWSNSLHFSEVGLADHSHAAFWMGDWWLWYDNFVVSDSYIGPLA